MRPNDEVTAEYIKDLETLLDLVTAERDDLREENRSLLGQLKLLRQDRRYECAS